MGGGVWAQYDMAGKGPGGNGGWGFGSAWLEGDQIASGLRVWRIMSGTPAGLLGPEWVGEH